MFKSACPSSSCAVAVALNRCSVVKFVNSISFVMYGFELFISIEPFFGVP